MCAAGIEDTLLPGLANTLEGIKYGTPIPATPAEILFFKKFLLSDLELIFHCLKVELSIAK